MYGKHSEKKNCVVDCGADSLKEAALQKD